MNEKLFPRAQGWRRRVRIGSNVPCEGVHPQKGSYLTYGTIAGWINENGPCSRKDATRAIIESSQHFVSYWGLWAEEHAWLLDPFGDEDQLDDNHKKDRMRFIDVQSNS